MPQAQRSFPAANQPEDRGSTERALRSITDDSAHGTYGIRPEITS
jgi:hypothetical protein